MENIANEQKELKKIRFINVKFIKSASKKAEFIADELQQVAIVGRSNVGKSSLINLLVNNSKMAKTSSTPGRTRLVNYFNINNQFYLVDLPGYGYHKAGKEHTTVWDNTMNDYFTDNQKLKAVMLLLDARLKPTELDKQMLDYLAERDIPVVLVLTKTDKISRSEINLQKQKISTELRFNKSRIVATSTLKKQGVEDISQILEEFIN
ncbi:MAG: YihA family ribosome biogenesis GTP-binding protein [Clostridia bacterium]|nr:YihA family ribosome biogenesis GTP-binding protein [Clostridia bacterium]